MPVCPSVCYNATLASIHPPLGRVSALQARCRMMHSQLYLGQMMSWICCQEMTCAPNKPHPTSVQQQPWDDPSACGKPEGSAVTDHTETDTTYTEPSALDLPSVPARNATAASIKTTDNARAETQDDLFARLHALKASAAPAQSLSTLTDRHAALKGPKVTAAELQDLQSRLEHLKGGKNTVPLSELEGRLAKLKGTCPTPTCQLGQLKGRPHGHLIPDFDPDVEMNQEQLEALASMGDSCAENTPFDQRLLASTHQQEQPPADVPTTEPTPDATAVANPIVLQQGLQDFDPEDEGCLTEQQLRALASMPTTGTADAPQESEAVPGWAAALGLSAKELKSSSEPENGLQSGSSDSDESSDRSDASEKGRRGMPASNTKQAQFNRMIKLARQRRT